MVKEKTLKILLIALALIIIMIWVAIIIIQNYNTRMQFKEEKLHNLLYLEILKKAIINNILSLETIEELLIQKISVFNNFIGDPDSFDENSLLRICRENSIHEISFVDDAGRVIVSSREKKEFPYDLSLLELEPGQAITLDLPDETSPDHYNLFYIRKIPAGYFLGSIGYTEIAELTRSISLADLMEYIETSMAEKISIEGLSDHIKYVVIQDTLGIIAATKNIASLTKIGKDDFLKNSYESQLNASRITAFGKEQILETVSPFFIDDFYFGIIRLGASISRIEQARERKLFVIIVFTFIIMAILFLEYVFFRNFGKLQKSTRELNSSRRMVEIARLGGEVAHEIKNPLNSIFMVLQRIKTEFEVRENQGEYENLLDISYREIQRMDQIIERFLSYTRKTILNKTRTRVKDIIADTVSLFTQQASQEGIILGYDCQESLVALLDDKKIRQVLMNLMKNAIESFDSAISNKTIKINTAIQKNELTIRMEDNGRGIEETSLPFIWDLYYSTKESGNGIGLAVTRKIIEAHQGKISVESVKNKGTIISIVLPLTKEVENEDPVD